MKFKTIDDIQRYQDVLQTIRNDEMQRYHKILLRMRSIDAEFEVKRKQNRLSRNKIVSFLFFSYRRYS